MIQEGDPAPDFRLVGLDSNEAGLYRLSDEIQERPVLLSFQSVPTRSPADRVLEPLQWFQLIDELAVFVVSNGQFSTYRESALGKSIPVPLLVDTDESVANRYDVRYNGHESPSSNVALYLIDQSQRVQYAVSANDFSQRKAIDYRDVWRDVRQYYPTKWEHRRSGMVEYA